MMRLAGLKFTELGRGDDMVPQSTLYRCLYDTLSLQVSLLV